jgi:hypothetical protein
MTPTEKLYTKHIGKLFLSRGRTWGGEYEAVMMPISISNQGGWWYYQLEAITNKEAFYRPDSIMMACRSFLRQSVDYKKHLLEVPQNSGIVSP